MAKIDVAGEAFNVLIEGDEEKDVLVLAHHLGGGLDVWDPLIPALTRHFRVLRYDSRGHGSSVANEGPYSIAQLARDAIGILDALGIEKAHWLGLSMGSIVGLAALVEAPERIGRAVLANTAAQMGTPDIWNARIQTARAGLEGLAEPTAERWFTAEFREAEPEAVAAVLDIFRKTPVEGYVAACAALRDVDLREAVRSIQNRALVLVGRHDPSAPPPLGAYVAGAIEGAKLVTLEASHISPIEDQEAFTEAVIDFLTSAESPARKAPLPRKVAARRTPARQPIVSRAPAKKAAPAKKTATKKAVAKKTAAKKTPVKKAAAKKSPAKKAAVKKSPVKKSVVRKAAPKKAAVKKATAKKASVKKQAAKTVVKRTPAKSAAKATAKKAAVKKTAAKKTVAKTAAAKTRAKSPQKKAVARKAPGRGRR